MTKTKRLQYAGLGIAIAIGCMSAGDAINFNSMLSPTARATTISSDKYDGDCIGTETAGRCADKCPPPSFIRAYDKVTGAAVCGIVTGCPYGDSIPLGPECDKAGAEQNPAAAPTPTPVESTPTTPAGQNCEVAQ